MYKPEFVALQISILVRSEASRSLDIQEFMDSVPFKAEMQEQLAGLLQETLRANNVPFDEIIVTLMMNYIAILILDFLVYGTWKDPASFGFPMTPEFSAGGVVGTSSAGADPPQAVASSSSSSAARASRAANTTSPPQRACSTRSWPSFLLWASR